MGSVPHNQLAALWQQRWAPQHAYGLRGKPAADVLVFDTCKFFSQAHEQGKIVGGVRYDFRKCFDSIPCRLAVNILRMRGCDNRL